MIHVHAQPEPALFDRDIRQKGLAFLRDKHIALDQQLPVNTVLRPYWRKCLDDLYQSYNGVCAYLGVHFERVTGSATVDHFIAKSKLPGLAYEWHNYRLACASMNSRKRDYETVLDPFEVVNGWFQLQLDTGHIYPNPELTDSLRRQVQDTIDRLGLDDWGNREMRARHYEDYRSIPLPSEFLARRSPFVWAEARRQGIL